mmetsp:Transcript_10150/g.46480  ORF Transcript_10150/g.46480 Transcript_10150/m.46480 type:complete len:219 (-) Transcript_10150:688-1344(-)
MDPRAASSWPVVNPRVRPDFVASRYSPYPRTAAARVCKSRTLAWVVDRASASLRTARKSSGGTDGLALAARSFAASASSSSSPGAPTESARRDGGSERGGSGPSVGDPRWSSGATGARVHVRRRPNTYSSLSTTAVVVCEFTRCTGWGRGEGDATGVGVGSGSSASGSSRAYAPSVCAMAPPAPSVTSVAYSAGIVSPAAMRKEDSALGLRTGTRGNA